MIVLMKADYKPTIGLEIHAELKTQTKMFCDSKNDPNETRPNVNICPICMGHPGTLPTINREAVRHVLRVGMAVGGEIADFTEFDRKNYFYPDIPKGYQISQYKYPLVKGGSISGISLSRIHLEEDTARSTHENGDYSLIDYNRAGLPLMELVTEPVLTSAKESVAFARELQLLLQYLEAGEANMEKGEMRVEANVSISSDKTLGTKVEVKNLNSFRAVERAIDYEIRRQSELMEKGEEVVQETRGWDESKGVTFSQRFKEEAEDYRYFPEPDLPKLSLREVPEFSREALSQGLPELPWQKRVRLKEYFGLKDEDVEMFVRSNDWSGYFEKVAAILSGNKKALALSTNYITSDYAGLVQRARKETSLVKIEPKDFAELMIMAEKDEISSRGAKDILKIMFEKGGRPQEIAKAEGLFQKSDESELGKTVESVIQKNKDVASDFKAGKPAALQYLIGQAMKETKGAANPQVLKKLFEKALS